MARPGWPERNKAARSFRQLRRFLHVINSDKVFGTHRYDTLSGRVGYVMGPLMLYAKGGAAWMNADYRMEVNSGLDGSTVTNTTRPGWIAGGGFEYMLGSRWSAKLEYDHLGFGSKTLAFANPFGNGVTFKTAVNEVKAGVNYHFDGLLSF